MPFPFLSLLPLLSDPSLLIKHTIYGGDTQTDNWNKKTLGGGGGKPWQKDNFCRILTMVCWYWTNCTFGLYPSSGVSKKIEE
jgi:hypothetical protein